MAKSLARRTTPHIAVIDGQPSTTSRDIAETFGKRHDDVLKRIRALDCSAAYRARNFAETFHDVAGPNNAVRREVEYRITRDGFVFLCMGFTGSKAAQWKERYINTFNRMADKLSGKASKPAPPTRPQPLRITHQPAAINPDIQAAINTRAFEIVSSALPGVNAWLTQQARDCLRPDGSAAPNLLPTLAHADFAAYSTNWASKHLATAEKLLAFIHTESAEAIARVQAERQRLRTLNTKATP